MTWQHTAKEDSFTAKGFVFTDGGHMDLRLAYRTVSGPGRMAFAT